MHMGMLIGLSYPLDTSPRLAINFRQSIYRYVFNVVRFDLNFCISPISILFVLKVTNFIFTQSFASMTSGDLSVTVKKQRIIEFFEYVTPVVSTFDHGSYLGHLLECFFCYVWGGSGDLVLVFAGVS